MQTNFNVTTTGELPSVQSRYAYQCFPVRNNARFSHGNDGGAWLVEYKALKKQDFHKSFARQPVRAKSTVDLTGYYLVKQCYVEQPEDICILNISGKNLASVDDEDFSLFSNVVHIDASDNNLPIETFLTFPNLDHLELQVNSIASINLTHQDFASLKKLDLSYNSLTDPALLNLGKLRNILELSLRGCGLKSLPPQLARGYQVAEGDSNEKRFKAEKKTRFPQLTHLDLSENNLTDISTFASLAGLRRLKTLNLSCNKITGVPHLRLMAAHRHFSLSTFAGSDIPLVDDLRTTPEDNVDEKEVSQRQINTDENSAVDEDIEKLEDLVEQANQENEEREDDEEENDKEEKDMLEGIEETISRISSNKDAEETNELLSLDFAQELNFSLNVPMTTARTVTSEVEGDVTHGNNSGEVPIQVSLEESPRCVENHGQEDSFLNTANELLDEDLKRPFACLETMDLSYNQISNEEALLALTSWPALQHLKLWGNPLMRAYKGIPPIIYHHLKVMCGINIIRKEPRPQPKQQPIAPGMINSTKVRKIKNEIQPIKRNNLMAIEQMILQAIENKASDKAGVNETAAKKVVDEDKNVADSLDSASELGRKKNQEKDDTENFFLTQVNEEGIELSEETSHHNIHNENEQVVDDVTPIHDDSGEEIDDVAELLKIEGDDEEDITIPATIGGSVRALRHMLNNELVFNKGGSHYNKKKKSIIYKSEKKQPRRDDINNALDIMRLSDHSSQENLAVVLNEHKDDAEIQRKFPEAKEMMKRVQEKYDHVRSNSLRPISETQQHLKQYSTRTEHLSQELVLSRMRKGKIGDLYMSRGNTPRVKIRGTRYDKVLH